MARRWSERAPLNDWWYWSTAMARADRHAASLLQEGGEMVFVTALNNRADELSSLFQKPVAVGRRLWAAADKTPALREELRQAEEAAVLRAVFLLRDGLQQLPDIARAVQDLLLVEWRQVTWEACDAPSASTGPLDRRLVELFAGPRGRADEGIRSGQPEDGGLPGILRELLMAERGSSNRTPTDYGKNLLASFNIQNPHLRPGVNVANVVQQMRAGI